MELAFAACLIGFAAAAALTGLWAGFAMLLQLPVPTGDQVVGAIMIGACGLPVAAWVVMLVHEWLARR